MIYYLCCWLPDDFLMFIILLSQAKARSKLRKLWNINFNHFAKLTFLKVTFEYAN